MSKFDYLTVGDTIIITGIHENLFECSDESYDTLLGVMNQPCEVVAIYNDIDLFDLSVNCDLIEQKGVLIKSPKLQGHDGGGKCPEYNCYWISEEYVSFESSFSIDDTMDIFDKLNESEDDFGWAEEIVKDVPDVVDYRTVEQGDKVVPGKDWMFGNQAQGSVYGFISMEAYDGKPRFIEDSTDEEFHQYWVHVDWVNKNGKVMFRNNYRVGPKYYDLKYYVPKPPRRQKKRIKESEDAIREVTHKDLHVGMSVIVDGYQTGDESLVWDNKFGKVVYDWREDVEETANSLTIAFDDWFEGHDGNRPSLCGHNRCWSFYDECAHSDEDDCENISNVKFYTIDTYDLFDQLNESEEDDFGWAKESISQEYHRYGDILPYLDYDDIISVTGDITSDAGEVLLSVKDEPFKVSSVSHPMKKNKTIYLKWVQPEDKRPKNWEAITNDHEQVAMGDDTSEWDKELMVKILHKEDHPF